MHGSPIYSPCTSDCYVKDMKKGLRTPEDYSYRMGKPFIIPGYYYEFLSLTTLCVFSPSLPHQNVCSRNHS